MKNQLISSLAPNQLVILSDNGDRYFKSYQTPIISIENGKISLNSNYWNGEQTNTTNKYLAVFLKIGGTGVKKYIDSAIESGLIKLTKTMRF